MPFLALTTLACVGWLFFISYQCGMMRGKHEVPAGSIEGPDEYQRYSRSQANMIEGMMMFLPSVWIFGHFGSATLAGVLALVFLGARVMYHRAYVTEPATRGIPFTVGVAATALAWIGALVSIAIAAFR